MKNILNTLIISVFILIVILLSSCMTAKKKAEMAQNKPLVGTYWVLQKIKGDPIPQSIAITPNIVFDSDGKFSGNLGCNLFYGNYSCGKKRIKMEYEGATKKLCQNMKMEKLLLPYIHADFKRYEIHQDTLVLLDTEGEVLRFFAGVRPE